MFYENPTVLSDSAHKTPCIEGKDLLILEKEVSKD